MVNHGKTTDEMNDRAQYVSIRIDCAKLVNPISGPQKAPFDPQKPSIPVTQSNLSGRCYPLDVFWDYKFVFVGSPISAAP